MSQRFRPIESQQTLSNEQAILEAIATGLAPFDAALYEPIDAVSEQGDLDTADLLNEVSRNVSKAPWFVEAHRQGQGTAGGQIAQPTQ